MKKKESQDFNKKALVLLLFHSYYNCTLLNKHLINNMKYYIYRDPSRNKIGATQAPESRIEVQQGLSPWRDYIIDTADNAMEASHLEAYYKGFYKAKWDNDIYMTIIKEDSTNMAQEPPFEGTLIQKGTYFQESYSRPALVDKARDNEGLYFNDNKGNESFFTATEVSKLMESYVIQKSQYNDGWYALPSAILAARERFDEERMNIIGQNGNTGEHYEKEQEFVERVRELEKKTVISKASGDVKVTINNPDNVVATGIYDDFYDAGICGTPDEDREHREANPCCHSNTIPEFQQIRDWADGTKEYSLREMRKRNSLNYKKRQGKWLERFSKMTNLKLLMDLGIPLLYSLTFLISLAISLKIAWQALMKL